ncbi:restriction endonuclease subunit S [Bacteroides fragilis]|nr:type I restriction modification DNA specificity domain protein [Bacteroides fragilis str. 2-F-2 \
MAIDNKDKKVLKSSIEREQNEVACSAECEKIKGSKNLNVPHLRFPKFSGEWEMVSLQDIATINPKSDPLQNTFIYIDLEAVEKGELRKIQEIMREEAPSRAQRVIDNNDILFQCVRPYQKNNYIHRILNTSNQQWVASTGYAQIRTTELPNYIYHLLNTDEFNRKVMVRCTGSSYPAINSEDLATIHLYYTPDKKEQLKISRLLDLLDKRIATQNKIIEDLKKLKSAISERLFKSVKGSTVLLSDLCDIVKGKQINGENLSDSGNYYVMNGGTEPSGYYDNYNVEASTISISEGGNSCGYVQFNTSPFWSGGHCYSIQNIADKVDNMYLYHYLKSNEDAIMKLRIGSGLPNIQKKDLAMFKIIVPKIEWQIKISTFLSSLERKAEIEERIQNVMQKQKLYLLQQMFI